MSNSWAMQQTITLSIPGMNCSACPITIKKALEKVSGVIRIQVDADKKQASVIFDDTLTTKEQLTQATTNAGYPSSVLKEGL